MRISDGSSDVCCSYLIFELDHGMCALVSLSSFVTRINKSYRTVRFAYSHSTLLLGGWQAGVKGLSMASPRTRGEMKGSGKLATDGEWRRYPSDRKSVV